METYSDILSALKLQMTQATFNTWLIRSTGELKGSTLTITLPNPRALDWVDARLRPTIERTATRIVGRSIKLQLTVEHPQATGQNQPGPVPDSGPSLPESRAGLNDPNIPPRCRFGIEIVSFDPTDRGWVKTSNYALQFWQPYLGTIPFVLWQTLRSFPSSWRNADKKQWPSIQTLADICASHNRHAILGRAERGEGKSYRKRTVGALEILEEERIVWPQTYEAGRDVIYYFRVLGNLPILTPAQVGTLTPRLQERHSRELAKCNLDYYQWLQLTLPSLAEDQQ